MPGLPWTALVPAHCPCLVRPFTLKLSPQDDKYSPDSVTLGLDLTLLTCKRQMLDPCLCILQGWWEWWGWGLMGSFCQCPAGEGHQELTCGGLLFSR